MRKLRIKNLTFSHMSPLTRNPMISHGYVDIAYAGKNRNHSYISDEVMHEKLEPSVKGVPIVGEYFEEVEDFGDHGGRLVIDNKGFRYEVTTIPYGFVPPDADITYIDKIDDDGISRKYLRAECYLWTGQYPECERVFKTNNPQSMELTKDTGYWKRIEGDDYYVIEDAIISKLCILGTDVEPCFEGAQFGTEEDNMIYSLDKKQFNDFIETFAKQIKEALEPEGGESMNLTNNTLFVNEPAATTTTSSQIYSVKVNYNQNDDVLTEDNNIDDANIDTNTEDTNDYDLNNDDVVDVVEDTDNNEDDTSIDYAKEITKLAAEIEVLQNSLEEANKTIHSLNNELDELKQFKNQVDMQEKEELFNTFKNKNVIRENDLNSVYEQISELDYESLNLQLCKLYAESVLSKDETTPKNVVNYQVQEPDISTWESAIANKKAKNKK